MADASDSGRETRISGDMCRRETHIKNIPLGRTLKSWIKKNSYENTKVLCVGFASTQNSRYFENYFKQDILPQPGKNLTASSCSSYKRYPTWHTHLYLLLLILSPGASAIETVLLFQFSLKKSLRIIRIIMRFERCA